VLVTVLNVDPGGKAPSRAWSNESEPGSLTDASTWPVEARTATRAAFLDTAARAASAALCTAGSMLVSRGLPGLGAMVATLATVVPLAATTVMVAPGAPASWLW